MKAVKTDVRHTNVRYRRELDESPLMVIDM
jgi:hypothetical protein